MQRVRKLSQYSSKDDKALSTPPQSHSPTARMHEAVQGQAFAGMRQQDSGEAPSWTAGAPKG